MFIFLQVDLDRWGQLQFIGIGTRGVGRGVGYFRFGFTAGYRDQLWASLTKIMERGEGLKTLPLASAIHAEYSTTQFAYG